MTATPPPASGGGPTIDRRVTILAACSVLCTVIALVCLGLLVFTGDKDADATTASAGGTDNGSTGDDSPDPDSSRPDNLTDAGWSDGPSCQGTDPWIYAAENASEKELLCFGQQLIYPGDADSESIDVDTYQMLFGICPVTDSFQTAGRYLWANMDLGWTEFNGTSKYVRLLDLKETDPDKMYSLTETTYDRFWTNESVQLSPLKTCPNGPRTSAYDELVTEELNSRSTTTEAASSGDLGPCELDAVRKNIDEEWIDEADSFRYCDGKWAQIGIDRTDALSDVIEWDGTEWNLRYRDGKIPPGWGKELSCYDEDKLIADGVPYKATGDETLYVTLCSDEVIRPHPDE